MYLKKTLNDEEIPIGTRTCIFRKNEKVLTDKHAMGFKYLGNDTWQLIEYF